MLLLLYFGGLFASISAISNKSHVPPPPPPENLSNVLECNYKKVDFMLYSAKMVGRSPRIFLLGDSILGDMCRDTAFCNNRTEDESSAFTVKLKPNFSSPSNWSHFEMHNLNGGLQMSVYHLSQTNKQYVYIFERELFLSFHPKVKDILILLFGAYFRGEKVTWSIYDVIF
jgi:hypothetical protein